MAVLVAAMMIMAMCVPAWAEEPGTYNLTFDGNGGTPSAASKPSGSDGKVMVDATATRTEDSEGRNFALIGWTETDYNDALMFGDRIPSYWKATDQLTLTEAKTVYALWGYDLDEDGTADVLQTNSGQTKAVITYDANGGTGAPSTVAFPATGTYVVSTQVPTWANHNFLGWQKGGSRPAVITATDRSGYTGTLASATESITADITFYAVWADNKNGNSASDYTEALYTVTYDPGLVAQKNHVVRTLYKNDTTPLAANDLTNYVAQVNNILTGTTYTLVNDVSAPAGTLAKYDVTDKKVNVAFIGWTKNKSLAYDLYDRNAESTAALTGNLVTSENITEHTTYYAVWGVDDDADGTPNYNKPVAPDQDITSGGHTITIKNITNTAGPVDYAAYRMLRLVVDTPTTTTTAGAYAYTVDEDWAEFFRDDNSSVWGTVLQKNSMGYFTALPTVSSEDDWSSASALSAFAEAAAKYAADKGLTPDATATANNNQAVLNTTVAGYYLVTSTLGTRAMIDTTPGDVETKEKNGEDTIVKKVQEDSNIGGVDEYGEENDADIAQVVNFKSEATIVPRTVKVVIHDTMESGLSLIADSIKVFTDSALTTEYKDATIRTSTADTGDTFSIDIPNKFAATAGDAQILYITYSAYLTADSYDATANEALRVKNETWVTYGDHNTGKSALSATYTTMHCFKVRKIANGGSTNIAGAVFQLKKNGVVMNLIKVDEKTYRVADATENAGTASTYVNGTVGTATIAIGTLVSDFVTIAGQDIQIWGVDSDDDYTLAEIQAPNGYFLPDHEFDVDVAETNNTVETIENVTSTELPSTGGMGTTVLYIVGGMLVILAGAYLFFSRKRTA